MKLAQFWRAESGMSVVDWTILAALGLIIAAASLTIMSTGQDRSESSLLTDRAAEPSFPALSGGAGPGGRMD